jgi:hypothetical protein
MERKLKKGLLFITISVVLVLAINFEVGAQGRRVREAAKIYDSLVRHKIESPKTVLAIVIYETGWMQCKDCALEGNNLFGFRTNTRFLKFSSVTESIKYMKRWQTKYYKPWKARHPNGTYYEYLRYIRYCDNMDNYIRKIKSIEQWISVNIGGTNK